MKKLFTLSIALLSMFALVQSALALTYTVTVPSGTNACFITGDMNGWNPVTGRMTKVNETTYTIDLPKATETHGFKYLSGPNWPFVEKDAAGAEIANRTYSANDVVASWASVFVPDEREVTIEALVPSEVKELYLVGSFNGWASPSADFKMTFESEDIDGKIYSIKVTSIDAINMEFKFIAGPAWAYEQLDPSTNFIYGSTENTVAVVVNSFKEYYDASKTGTINIIATVPAGTAQVFIQGDHLGWNMENAVEGVKNTDGTFSFSIPMVMSISYRLYNKADWGYPEVAEDDATKERPNRTATYPADANTAITVAGWKQVIDGLSKTTEATNRIYTRDNILTVEKVISKVEIYDFSGRMIESANVSGTFKSKTLRSGLYIVKVDGATKKATVN
jgi:hypothetical protein